MNALELVSGVDFDCTAPNIRCRADRVGAIVHEIPSREMKSGFVRVLAHDEPSAKAAATAYDMFVKEESERLNLR